jgi:hypothetical protein
VLRQPQGRNSQFLVIFRYTDAVGGGACAWTDDAIRVLANFNVMDLSDRSHGVWLVGFWLPSTSGPPSLSQSVHMNAHYLSVFPRLLTLCNVYFHLSDEPRSESCHQQSNGRYLICRFHRIFDDAQVSGFRVYHSSTLKWNPGDRQDKRAEVPDVGVGNLPFLVPTLLLGCALVLRPKDLFDRWSHRHHQPTSSQMQDLFTPFFSKPRIKQKRRSKTNTLMVTLLTGSSSSALTGRR